MSVETRKRVQESGDKWLHPEKRKRVKVKDFAVIWLFYLGFGKRPVDAAGVV